MLNLKKYQAFNMNNDYRQRVECPYGCKKQLIEEQLLLHVAKCSKRDDELFGHCRYNYLHIMPKINIPYHEENCPSNITMTEDDFTYKPDPKYVNQNFSWIQDDVSLLYAKYFVASSPVNISNQDNKKKKWFSSKLKIEVESQQEQENYNTEQSESIIDQIEVKDVQKPNISEVQLQENNLESVEILGLDNQNKSYTIFERTIGIFKRIISFFI